ncbi:MAG: choice-of-anchor D domain-containing protein [Candidatus Limnocylindrales bacterium]
MAATPNFTVGPTQLTFPDTVVGFTSGMQSVVLTNVSGTAQAPNLAGGALFHHTDFASDGQTCGLVQPGGTCEFRYHFAPTKLGALTDGTTIGVDNVNYSITLKGKAITGINVSSTTLQFPDTPVGQLSATMQVTLTNISTQVLHPGIGGGALASGRDFIYDGENCSDTMAPGNACEATYQFAPKSSGRRTDRATLTVAGGSLVITLVGGRNPATPRPTASPTKRPTPLPSPTASPTASPTPTPTLSPSPTVLVSVLATPAPTASAGFLAASSDSAATQSSPLIWLAVLATIVLVAVGGFLLGRRRT